MEYKWPHQILREKFEEFKSEVRELAKKGNFGAAIRMLRKYEGLKVYELARKVHVNPVYITQIEKHNKTPSPLVMKKISDSLNNPELLGIFIKMKYPDLYTGIDKVEDVLEHELLQIDKEFKRKDLTSKELRSLINRQVDIEERIKELIEKLYKLQNFGVKIKTTREHQNKSKD